jgi:hypothetical protein
MEGKQDTLRVLLRCRAGGVRCMEVLAAAGAGADLDDRFFGAEEEKEVEVIYNAVMN